VVARDDPRDLGDDHVGVGLAVDREVERFAALADLDADRRLEVPVDPERHPHVAVEGPFVAVAEPEQGQLPEGEQAAGRDADAVGPCGGSCRHILSLGARTDSR
jgi:hypothetical protein